MGNKKEWKQKTIPPGESATVVQKKEQLRKRGHKVQHLTTVLFTSISAQRNSSATHEHERIDIGGSV